MSLRYLLKFVSRDLSTFSPDVLRDCKKLIRHFAHSNESIGSRVTFPYLAKLVGKDDVNDIAPLISYITSQRMPMMMVKFEYYRHPDAMPILIDDEDAKDIFTDGVFYDPVTGLEVESFEKKIVPFLVLNRSLLKQFKVEVGKNAGR